MLKFKLYPLFVLLILSSWAYCQNNKEYYKIDITKDQYKPYTGHIKMGTNVSPSGETLSYTNVYFTKNNKPWFPVMGEMNVEKTPRALWEEGILKLKAAGVQIVSTYVVWINHEEVKGVFNWSGNNDYATFLELCKKHGMKVWLRIGPWAHFETRNGGFPDWLMQEKLHLRTNDEKYLNYVDRFFQQINLQVSKFYFKNGGPVIGVQLENEMEAKSSDANYQHMLRLKELAIKNQIDVPYYSIFAAIRPNQNEFFRMIGGYGDSPWAQNTDKIYKSVYYFSPLENDSDIGSDLFGKLDTKLYSSLPATSAEIGTGLHKTYHRRNVFSPKDKLGSAFTRIGSGLTGLGYFMFHGGVVQDGKLSTLQESRTTGYPNDILIKNYDFQAPIGAMGNIDASYHEFKLLNQFINNFESELVVKPAFFPVKRVQSPTIRGVVKVAVRSQNNSGFIFISNYQRLVDLPKVDDFQVEIKYKDSTLRVPSVPTTIQKDEMTIWPFNLDMQGSNLIYATARPTYKLNTKTGLCYVFSANNDAEFVYDMISLAEKPVSNEDIQTRNQDGKLYINFTSLNKPVQFTITPKNGKEYQVIVLNKSDALNSWKIEQQSFDYLVVTDALVLDKKDYFSVQKAGNSSVSLSVYPSLDFTPSASWKLSSSSTLNSFKNYVFNTQKISADASFKKEITPAQNYWISDSTFLKKVKSAFKYPLTGAKKIWTKHATDTLYYRFNFNLSQKNIKNTILAYSGDDEVELYCNGQVINIFSKNNFATVISLNKYLLKGDNLLAAKVVNHNNEAGLIAKLYLENQQQIDTLISDSTWLVSSKYQINWNKNQFKADQWKQGQLVTAFKNQIVWDAAEPGLLYGRSYQPSPGQALYSVQVPKLSLNGPIKDVYYVFKYHGDMVAYYNTKNHLVYDDYADGKLGTIISRSCLKDDSLRVQIFPVRPFYKLYIEDNLKDNFYKGVDPELMKIEAYPLYELQLSKK